MADLLGRLQVVLADTYQVERELGQGGMATVYLAHDRKHDRKVAIKVLRPELAAVLGAERFLAEIRTTANLQHPHILPLFDSGIADGFLYYVMPFVEGESLRDRLRREQQLPLPDAVRIAGEVADALDYAHRHNVIHRDIKPENVLLHDGRALVADFGIALAASRAGDSRMTETGMSLGTPHYMSPEQAMGQREITARSDIYSLGAMTYEMLLGEPPFSGPTAQAIVAKVMTETPAPPSRHRDTVPEAVDDAVLTALAKLPADRFATAAEFAAALTGEARPGRRSTRTRTRAGARAAAPRGRHVALFGGLALAAILGLAALVTVSARPGTGTTASGAPVIRFVLEPGSGSELAFPIWNTATYLALSPDGQQVVYAARHGGPGWVLDIRRLDQLHARTLPGTEGGTHPQFSPDGRWIAFGAADGSLKKVAADGTGLSTLAPLDVGGVMGITWTSDREIVFGRVNLAYRGLWRVSSDGGEPVMFTRFDSATGERLQLSPHAVDGGRLVLYSSTQASNLDLKIAVVPMATGVPKVLTALSGGLALGLIEGYLLYLRNDGALMAAPFDPRKLEAGAPIQVLDSIAARGVWLSPAALSASGSLLYQRGGLASEVVRVDHRGIARVLLDSARVYTHPRLSPDGRRLAIEVGGGRSNEIWIADLAAGTFERLTREGFNDRPEWTPDGTRILYSSSRSKANSLWWQPADGSGPAELVHQGPDAIREGVFTPDGGSIVFRSDTPDSNRDVFRLPLTGDRVPVPILTGINDDKHPRVSPDGKLLAYTSNETGREEVYLRALSGRAARVRVSTGGGGEPLWSPDGRRLYYRAGVALMAATVAASPAPTITGRDTLFTGQFSTSSWHQNYDVAPDGKSFVMLRPLEEHRQLVMVVNWIEELRRRTAGKR
jgi:Tol biopolymer transport system component/tRNA A-37 threonylcarbamoyl transferase component Bud32